MDTINQKKYLMESKKDQSINVLDLFKYLLHHWKWFALSILVFGGYFYYQYSKTPFVFSQSEVVMIKTLSNTPTTARITRSSVANAVSVKDEIIQLKSKELMRLVVNKIGAEKSYKIHSGLRDYELYKKSPVQVKVEGKSLESNYSFIVTPVDSRYAIIKGWDKSSDKEIKISLNQLVATPVGKVLITPSKYYKEYYGKDIFVTKYPRESVMSQFVANLKIKQMDEDASLLQVSMEDQSSERAADAITALINVYNEVYLQDKNKIAENTANFIKDRLAIIEGELGSVESNIEDLKIANQGIDIATAGSTFLTEKNQYKSEGSKIETDIRLAEMMRSYLTTKGKQNNLIPNNTGLVDASVESQIAEYNTTLLKRNRLAEGGNTLNPVVLDLDDALMAMRNNISRAVDNTLKGQKIKLNNAQKEEGIAQGKVLQMPQKERTMLSVERQRRVKEDLYMFLLNKREENALNEAITEANLRIIDPPVGESAPIAPNRLKKIATGIGIGVALPTIILLSMLLLNTGIRGRQDLENVLSVPFLGEIPLARSRKQGRGDVLVSKSGRDPLTEAFRILRTNINFMTKDDAPPKVLTFTSFSAGVGKTFSVLNLATTLSYLEKKVVVIDLDLRKGTLSSRVGLLHGKGTSHYLSSPSISVDEIIHKSDVADGVDFIPIGAIAPNPVELLLGKRLDELIKELKERYDYVIIDGVPVGIVADASIIDRVADLTLFIIRIGKMDRRQLPEIEKLYQEKKLSNLAIVLNGLKLNGYGYGYGGYGYGSYGYGYGEEKKKSVFDWFKRS
ncbi:polysaccharide biosynthesis tyrosine autokinase [Elizabethkingia anophelis]|uniref:GumC family protein n=1 Tax=Elizabethkingia anophelis TaxID=1117645 RepID=UPI000666344E|nr:polysaccharide biosynthesis tyrosine autokinase [Elizabethkingia anophelis]AQW91209.1 chromosome partitioning protein ParA [Elizabethkingia anophelis]KUY14075.1 chromosome partitioning protein ParA [Elizabethkingia anophelis]MCT3726520.1 polysaccharide biosynthesis tyrosine autokinase [Elizabethkingia anophelis]MCT4237387.1 polysaccharide biosynthesis tyrosine autokinase [Elizabethkingia anophelis]MCT4318651.1 polysaccharide biosynthesis tyrosine autokinase [Elizabethkingia anophelis]